MSVRQRIGRIIVYGRAIGGTAGAVLAMGIARLAAAAGPTQEDVFRSIERNVGSPQESHSAAPFFYLVLGLIALIVAIHIRRQRQTEPVAVNHPGKLMRELAKALGLTKSELQQLRLLAKGASVENPVVLLLCPSVLTLALRTASSEKLDKRLLADLGRRLSAR